MHNFKKQTNFTHSPESHPAHGGVAEWLLAQGSAPWNPELKDATAVKPRSFTRQTLEKIANLSINKPIRGITREQRKLGILLSSITRNRLLAKNKIYKKDLKKNRDYIRNWLLLKATLRTEVINALLLRQDKIK